MKKVMVSKVKNQILKVKNQTIKQNRVKLKLSVNRQSQLGGYVLGFCLQKMIDIDHMQRQFENIYFRPV